MLLPKFKVWMMDYNISYYCYYTVRTALAATITRVFTIFE